MTAANEADEIGERIPGAISSYALNCIIVGFTHAVAGYPPCSPSVEMQPSPWFSLAAAYRLGLWLWLSAHAHHQSMLVEKSVYRSVDNTPLLHGVSRQLDCHCSSRRERASQA